MRDRILKWLRKARRNRITLLAVSSSGGAPRGVALPVLYIWILIVAVSAIAGFMLVSYVAMTFSAAQSSRMLEAKEATIRELTTENYELRAVASAQQDRLAYLSEQFVLMESKMRRISDLGEEIVATLGSEVDLSVDVRSIAMDAASQYDLSSDEYRLGTGGIDRRAIDYRLTDSPGVFKIPNLTSSTMIETMLDRLSQGVEAFESLKSESEAYIHRINHTPSTWPVTGIVTSHYGFRVHPIDGVRRFHDGIDIAVSEGTAVRVTADGVVTWSGEKGGYGLTVIIDHGYGVETLYAHNSRLVVRRGTEVKRGNIIAYSGNTGNSTGPHVHYEVRVAGKTVDPMIYLK